MGAPTKMRRPVQLSHKTNSCKLQTKWNNTNLETNNTSNTNYLTKADETNTHYSITNWGCDVGWVDEAVVSFHLSSTEHSLTAICILSTMMPAQNLRGDLDEMVSTTCICIELKDLSHNLLNCYFCMNFTLLADAAHGQRWAWPHSQGVEEIEETEAEWRWRWQL